MDEVQAVIRANHLELNLGVGVAWSVADGDTVPSLATLCRELLCTSVVPLAGEAGIVTVDPFDPGLVPLHHRKRKRGSSSPTFRKPTPCGQPTSGEA